MTYYTKYVPSVYTPDPVVMLEILELFEVNDAFHYIPQIWSDMTVFEISQRSDLVQKVFQILAKAQTVDEKLQLQFSEMGMCCIAK